MLSASERGLQPRLQVALPNDLRNVLDILEVRLIYDKRHRRYDWHIVVENGKQPTEAPLSSVGFFQSDGMVEQCFLIRMAERQLSEIVALKKTTLEILQHRPPISHRSR